MKLSVSIQVYDDEGRKVLGMSPSPVTVKPSQLRGTVIRLMEPTLWQFENIAKQDLK